MSVYLDQRRLKQSCLLLDCCNSHSWRHDNIFHLPRAFSLRTVNELTYHVTTVIPLTLVRGFSDDKHERELCFARPRRIACALCTSLALGIQCLVLIF